MARKAVAKGGAKSSGRGGGSGGKAATVFIVIGTVLAVTALPLCILFVVGMMPTIVAAIVDSNRARYLARSVAAMNLAGLVQPLMAVLHVGISLASVQHVLADSLSWLSMYGAAAIGWLLTLAMPWIARVFVDMRADQLQRQLENRAEMLVKDWGEQVTGQKSDGSP